MRRAALVWVLGASAACHGFDGPDTFSDPVFSASLLAMDQVSYITPLGSMASGFHVIPTRHSYWYLVDYTRQPDVFAPGDGTIDLIDHHPDDRVVFKQAGDFKWFLDHVRLAGDLKQGSKVKAGQRLGTSSELSGSVDFGVTDFRVTVPFLTPARYDESELHADHPLKHFADPLRSQLLGLVTTTGDKYGTNCYDVAGTLAGNWFAPGTPLTTDAMQSAYWDGYLSFARDPIHPDRPVISSSRRLGVVADGAIVEGPVEIAAGPLAETVTAASGLVVFRVGHAGTAGDSTVIAQLTDATHLKIEAFPDLRANPAFDGNAKSYER